MNSELNYVRDEKGELTGVIVPIEIWREITSERETAYLLSDPERRERLLAAKARTGGLSMEEVCERFGFDPVTLEDLSTRELVAVPA